jgi:hypothetical protein
LIRQRLRFARAAGRAVACSCRTWDGTLERIHLALYMAVCEQAGREASPTTAINDSQSARVRSLDPQGFDAGK